MEMNKDHVHLLVKNKPKVSIFAIILKQKQETTIRLLKTQKKYSKKYCWKEHTLWSEGCFASAVDNVSKEVVGNYIRKKGHS